MCFKVDLVLVPPFANEKTGCLGVERKSFETLILELGRESETVVAL